MLIILFFHCILTILLGWVFLQRKDRSIQYLAAWLIMAVFPVGGVLICWILLVFQAKVIDDEPIESLENFKEEVPFFELIEPLNVTAETNIAPHEETLLIADYETRREVILNLLKEDVSSNINYINLALYNEDSETAHYAASGILHTKRKLDTGLGILSSLYQNDPSNLTIAFTYADLLHQYLTTVQLDPVDKLNYTYENARVLERIINNKRENKIVHLIRLIELLLETEDFNRTIVFCNKLWEEYPDSEEKFLILLKSYFVMKDKQHFDLVFKRFRDSDIYFSSDTMQVIRLWLGSVASMKNT